MIALADVLVANPERCAVGSLAITFIFEVRLSANWTVRERVFLASVKSQMVVVHEDQRYVLLHRLHVGCCVRAIL